MNILKKLSIGVLIMVFIIFGYLSNNLSDKHPGYAVDLNINPTHPPVSIKVGFSKAVITPPVTDTWNDVNKDAKYNPDERDSFNDENGNGEFDAVWMAGFHNHRPAQGIHDDLWARTMVLDDGETRLAIVALDVIGFLHDDVIDVRNALRGELNIDYTIISSTHTHEGPDLVGIWGEGIFKSGVDQDYLKYVKNQIVNSIENAAENIRLAKLKFSQELTGGSDFVLDSRNPQVEDHGIRIMQVLDIKSDTTLGSLIAWANHPETLWSNNLLISSDFPHYVRKSVEDGVKKGSKVLAEGIGGISVYVNGSIGGLMTTRPQFAIPDPFSGEPIKGATFEKAEAQGQQIGLLMLHALENEQAVEIDRAIIKLRAKTISIPLANNNFRLGFALGIIKHGTTGWMKVRTEVSAFQIGPASFITVPGEIYPEIVNGGVISPVGQDFAISPIETPSLRSLMGGEFKFVFGLANDEIGYIIPKSEWDDEPPYLFDKNNSPYGEVNSIGPEAAPIIYNSLVDLLRNLNNE